MNNCVITANPGIIAQPLTLILVLTKFSPGFLGGLGVSEGGVVGAGICVGLICYWDYVRILCIDVIDTYDIRYRIGQ